MHEVRRYDCSSEWQVSEHSSCEVQERVIDNYMLMLEVHMNLSVIPDAVPLSRDLGGILAGRVLIFREWFFLG